MLDPLSGPISIVTLSQASCWALPLSMRLLALLPG
jgi:hypothetical protein